MTDHFYRIQRLPPYVFAEVNAMKAAARPRRQEHSNSASVDVRMESDPEPFRALGSVIFAKKLMAEARVAVAPGVGFGEEGEGFVRLALVENEQRLRQAARGIKKMTAGE